MSDTATTRNRLRKIEPGTQPNAWGVPLNEDAGSDRLDEAIDGVVAFTLSGSKTLSSTNYETDEARMRVINITGGTGGTVTIPAVEKNYEVRNATSGNVTISNGSNSVVLVTGEKTTVVTDGTTIWKNDARDYTDAAILNASLSATLPSQTGNAGKVLGTDGSTASWTSVTASNLTGLATGVGDWLTTPTSANLRTAVTDETGSGSLVFANSPTLVTPALGTPSALVLSNATGLPITTGLSGLAAGVATFLGSPSSANLSACVTDETGTGAILFANGPTMTAPVLGTPASGVLDNCTRKGTLLDSKSASGASVEFNPISQAYSTLVVVAKGVSHNGAGSVNVSIEIGDDSNYAALAMAVSGSVANTVTWYGSIVIPLYTADAGTLSGEFGNLTSSPSASDTSTSDFGWRCTGGIDKIRLKPSSDSFDAGTFELWAI